ncbi:hypothetical protein EXIGLDRAFT_839778 [Exidia glandulosa HHB12029]|uniref:DUF6535 domain-containing protein n=1 Tax=Exidia glandulosa HHB12029 TaxID=1314781 RepID=A0A165ETW8_EXIGL|nr:hypothetical protein EXIGLDRAFT_839778 [Exidia glandulosa HHB12029]
MDRSRTDAFGEEAADNARVWTAYREEVTGPDAVAFQSWNRTLDVLLIFSGLFSAVSTTFIVDSYKSLRPDPVAYMADVLFAIASAQNASASSVRHLQPLGVTPESNNSRWINALWLVSLVISLLVALLCILAKQWLQEYHTRMTAPSQSAAHWARRHVLYSGALRRWRVDGIISSLPAALHLSLFLFLTGLVLLILPLDAVIAYALIAIILPVGGLYICGLLIPLWNVACPFRTPLTTQILDIWCAAHERLMNVAARCTTHILTTYLRSSFPLAKYVQRILEFADLRARQELMARTSPSTWADSLAESRAPDLTAGALSLLLASSNEQVASLAVQAIGSIGPTSQTISYLMQGDAQYDLLARLSKIFHELGSSSFDPHYNDHMAMLDYARFLKSTLVLSRYWTDSWRDFNIRWSYYLLGQRTLPATADFDLGLLEAAMNWKIAGRHEPVMNLVQDGRYVLRSRSSAFAVCALLLNETIEHPRLAVVAGLRILEAMGSLGECSDPELSFVHMRLSSVLRVVGLDIGTQGEDVPSLRCIELWSRLLVDNHTIPICDSLVCAMVLDVAVLIEASRKRTHPDAFRISDIQRLLRLFNSPVMKRSWSLRVIVLSLGLLKDVYRVEMQSVDAKSMNYDDLFEDLHCAVRNLASLATSDDCDPDTTYDAVIQQSFEQRNRGVFWAADWFGVLISRRTGHLRMVRTARDRGQILAEFLVPDGVACSLWHTMINVKCEPKRLFMLAGVLSTSLCTMRRRGMDITGLLAEFYHDGVWVTDCVRMAYSLRTVGAVDAWYPWSLALWKDGLDSFDSDWTASAPSIRRRSRPLIT